MALLLKKQKFDWLLSIPEETVSTKNIFLAHFFKNWLLHAYKSLNYFVQYFMFEFDSTKQFYYSPNLQSVQVLQIYDLKSN